MTCSQVFDLCLSNEQRIGVFRLMPRTNVQLRKRIDSRHGVIASSSTGLMQSHERKERKDNGCLKETVYQSEVKKVF
jgi:hypothetical protein